MSEAYYGQPLVITTSGGKDSDVCLYLAAVSGICYEVQHNHTSVDAPETVYHVREQFRRLELAGVKCTINYPVYKGVSVNMWTLIPQKLMPPTRTVRYCCAVLKEQGGTGRMITTGVRWAESVSRRSKRGIYESMPHDMSKKVVINNDNDDKRRLFKNCKLQAKRICNPIIDWTDRDVWEYILAEKSRSTRSMLAVITVSVVSAARWPDAKCGCVSLDIIQPINALISVRLIRCWKCVLHVASWTVRGVLGQPVKMCSVGGCGTAISSDK